MKLKVAVKDLRVGDILQPTGRKVTHNPYRGLFTPKGKHDLGIEGYKETFGSSTLVTIER